MSEKISDGWDTLKKGDIMANGSTKYTIIEVLGDIIFFTNVGCELSNGPSTSTKAVYKNANYKVIGAEWERAESAIDYLKSKGMIKDGKVIVQ